MVFENTTNERDEPVPGNIAHFKFLDFGKHRSKSRNGIIEATCSVAKCCELPVPFHHTYKLNIDAENQVYDIAISIKHGIRL